MVAVSKLKSNINHANLGKNKKKLFLYFDNSHKNQQIIFCSYIVNINENLRLMRRNVVLSAYNRATYLDQTQAIM